MKKQIAAISFVVVPFIFSFAQSMETTSMAKSEAMTPPARENLSAAFFDYASEVESLIKTRYADGSMARKVAEEKFEQMMTDRNLSDAQKLAALREFLDDCKAMDDKKSASAAELRAAAKEKKENDPVKIQREEEMRAAYDEELAMEQEIIDGYVAEGKAGDADSYFELGTLFMTGKLELTGADTDQGMLYYMEAARNGSTKAMLALANIYRTGDFAPKDDAKATSYLLHAAEAGNKDAYGPLAECYFHGIGIKKDSAKGMEWLRKASDSGNIEATYALSVVLISGAYGEKNEEEGFKRCKIAADNGNLAAEIYLASLYAEGVGVKKNLPESVVWYERVAARGNFYAAYKAGIAYYEGKGVKKNTERGAGYLRLAAKGRLQEAVDYMKENKISY